MQTRHELMTKWEVMKMLRISEPTVKRMVRRGDLNPIRINERGDMRFWWNEIEDIVAGRKTFAGPIHSYGKNPTKIDRTRKGGDSSDTI